jgi:site-specific recombinase XerC
MTGRDDVATVIAEFLHDAESGRYSRTELRDLRGALAHVGSELGRLPLDEVDNRDVQRLLDDLGDAGLAPGRLGTIVESLRKLYAYAIGRGLVRSSPVLGVTAAANEPSPKAVTPTDAVLAIGEYAVSLVVKAAMVALVLMALALVVALA